MFDINPLGMKMYLEDLERCATAPTRPIRVRALAAAHPAMLRELSRSLAQVLREASARLAVLRWNERRNQH